jgi:hypothetical protein
MKEKAMKFPLTPFPYSKCFSRISSYYFGRHFSHRRPRSQVGFYLYSPWTELLFPLSFRFIKYNTLNILQIKLFVDVCPFLETSEIAANRQKVKGFQFWPFAQFQDNKAKYSELNVWYNTSTSFTLQQREV